MNERIKELWIEGTQTIIPREGDYSSVSAKNIEKFAELMIEECASRVDNILRERKDGGGTMGDEIREHFGVTQ